MSSDEEKSQYTYSDTESEESEYLKPLKRKMKKDDSDSEEEKPKKRKITRPVNEEESDVRTFESFEMDILFRLITQAIKYKNIPKIKYYYSMLDQQHKERVPQLLIKNEDNLYDMCEYANTQFIITCVEEKKYELIDKFKYNLNDRCIDRIFGTIDIKEFKYVQQFIKQIKNMKILQQFTIQAQIELLQYGYDIKYLISDIRKNAKDHITNLLENFQVLWYEFPQTRDAIKQALQISFIDDEDVQINCEGLNIPKKKEPISECLIKQIITTSVKTYQGKTIDELLGGNAKREYDPLIKKYIITAHSEEEYMFERDLIPFIDQKIILYSCMELYEEKQQLQNDIETLQKENRNYRDQIEQMIARQSTEQ